MKFKKSILTSLLLGSLYATSASAGMSCEYIHGGKSFCEAITTNSQMDNSYQWSISGGSILGGTDGPMTSALCDQNSCNIQVLVTYPNGSNSTMSGYISSAPSGVPNNISGGGATGGGNSCIGTRVCGVIPPGN